MSALVLALTGTDHHPFERMVRWIDRAAARHADVRFTIQHGVARAPSVAEGSDYLTHERLTELLARADVVVCHGGPGLITEARDAGHLPICVPRDPALGEHVDDHQLRFAAVVGRVGMVRDVCTPAAFDRELSARLAAGGGRGVGPSMSEARIAARARAAAELTELITTPPVRSPWRRHV